MFIEIRIIARRRVYLHCRSRSVSVAPERFSIELYRCYPQSGRSRVRLCLSPGAAFQFRGAASRGERTLPSRTRMKSAREREGPGERFPMPQQRRRRRRPEDIYFGSGGRATSIVLGTRQRGLFSRVNDHGWRLFRATSYVIFLRRISSAYPSESYLVCRARHTRILASHTCAHVREHENEPERASAKSVGGLNIRLTGRGRNCFRSGANGDAGTKL